MKLLICILFLFVQYCAQAKPKVVTTFSVLEDIVAQLVGDKIEVSNLVARGIDPHLFEPGPKEISQVRGAKVLFANGLSFEPWLQRLIQAASKDLVVVHVSRAIEPRKVKEHSLDVTDPHAWNSPPELISYVHVVTDELCRSFPEEKDLIQKRTEAFVEQIESIHLRFSIDFSRVPVSKRMMLTTHDAAGYLAHTYSIKSISPLGLSTSEDFKTGDLSRLLSQIEREKVRVIFTEPSHHKVLTERLAAKANLNLGSELYLDGLSPRGAPADSILKMLNHNLGAILASMKDRGED